MPTVGIDTNEGHDMKKDTETRIREIQAEVAAIDEFAEGSIASSRKPYRLKDGTVRLASPQYRFKSRGARGKQVSKYIPPSAVARAKKLIENGEPLHTHLVCSIASSEGIEYLSKNLPHKSVTLWVAAIDEELTNKSYIVPGLGDAGDLAYGAKL